MISSVYVPFFCIQSYAVELHIDERMAFYLLAITNVASLFGRLFPNWLADRYDIPVFPIASLALKYIFHDKLK